MKEILIKKYIRYLFGWAILIFFFNKFFLRAWVLGNETFNFFQIIVFSLPNLIEAIIGTLILTGILFQLKQYFNKKTKDINIYLIAVIISAFYIISQELKLHNIGGNNVYDIYDLIASVIGLIITFLIFQTFGFIEK